MLVSWPWRSDLVLPAVVGLVGMIEIAAARYEPVGLALATYVLAALVLTAGRAAPLAVPLLVVGVYAVTPPLGFDVSEPASWVVLIASACFVAGLYAPGRRLGTGLASVLAALAGVYATLEWLTDFEPSVLFGLVVTVGAWALGRALREALDRSRCAGEHVARVRAGGALAAKRAAGAERERIAGELHDVLAHALGAMVVQASVAHDRVRKQPDVAGEAIRAVAQAGREGLAETGRLLRLLRDERNELGLREEIAAVASGEPAPGGAVSARLLRARDALLPSVVGVVGIGEILAQGYGFGTALASSAAVVLAVAALCARRVLPSAMPVAVAAIAVLAPLAGAATMELTAWIVLQALAFFAAGRHTPRSRAAWGLGSALASVALLAADAFLRDDLTADAAFAVGLLGAWAVGFVLREALSRARVLAAEAESARLEQELEAERAAAAERRRIARELHDILANSLSVMIVQASLAADLIESDPETASEAVAQVERAGRSALGEIGRLLVLVRDGADDPGTQPQYGVADVPALTEEYARAGISVQLDMDHLVGLPLGVDLSTYRIVQEGLTNALKHAPGSPVRVRLARCGSEIAIEVRNGPAAASGTVTSVPSGHGLVGLLERVTLFGGSLEARPVQDGGFVLTATIPLAREAA